MNKLIVLIVICLTSCAPRRPATVDEIGTKPHRSYSKSNSRHINNKSQNNSHQVTKGDSLYSIGFKYQIDYKTLAAINNIKPPYVIYPNQIIQLKGDTSKVVFKPESNSNVQTKPISNNQPIVAKKEPSNNTKSINKPTKTTQPSVTKKPVVNKQPIVEKTQPQKSPVVTPTKTDLNWLWPTAGKIRTTFLASNPARKGISIGGKEGQDVKATEAGVVVYSGNGLLGYGELIIIKHNDAYLSAYGHNKSLKVKEGQTVTRGQVIAELGSTGTNVNNLHFEIRKNGQPVNPLDYVKP